MCASLIALTCAALPAYAQGPVNSNEDVEAREEWFWAQRSFPFKSRPYDQMAFLHTNLSRILSSYASSSKMPPLGGSWRSIGPVGFWDPGSGFFGSGGQLDAGRISVIVPAMTAGGPMYLGTASGGVWRSTDEGGTWKPLSDNECSLTTGGIAIDPQLTNRVYIGTGEANSTGRGCGVLRSTDGGDTWTSSSTAGIQVSGGGVVSFYTMLVDKATAGTVSSTVMIAGVNFSSPNGIARSTNSGVTWTTVPSANVGSVTSIVPHPTQASTYYAGARAAATPAGRGVYRSTDAGATWTQLPALPVADPASVGRIELSTSKVQPNMLWALVADVTPGNSGRLLGLFKYDETTNAWTKLAAAGVVTAGTTRGDFGTQGGYDLTIAVDPRDPQKIFLAGVRAYRSFDGGASFQPMAMEIHCDWHVIVFDRFNPDIMWAGTDGGVFVSRDAGNTWVARNAGLAIAQYYPGISIHPQATRVMGGSQDNGTHLYTGSLFWDGFSGGDGGYTAINYKDPTILWGESQWSTNGAGIVRKDATSFRSRNTGIVASDRGAFIPPLVMDPFNPAKLYFGTHRLYRTINDGVLWAPISADLTGGSGVINSISISPADSNTIYVGTSDGRVQVTHDHGVTFVLATGLPARTVTHVVAHPTDPLRALITVSGFGMGHLFETQDGLASAVKNIGTGLVDAPANSAVYIPTQNVIAVGMDVGVFQSADNGATWALGPAGLPNAIVNDLVYQQATGTLVAATYGRGMWAYQVGGQAAVLRGDVNADGKVDAADALIVQQALAAAASMSTVVFPRGDANCNGAIDAADLVLILRAAVGLSTGSSCVGSIR